MNDMKLIEGMCPREEILHFVQNDIGGLQVSGYSLCKFHY